MYVLGDGAIFTFFALVIMIICLVLLSEAIIVARSISENARIGVA